MKRASDKITSISANMPKFSATPMAILEPTIEAILMSIFMSKVFIKKIGQRAPYRDLSGLHISEHSVFLSFHEIRKSLQLSMALVAFAKVRVIKWPGRGP